MNVLKGVIYQFNGGDINPYNKMTVTIECEDIELLTEFIKEIESLTNFGFD